MRISSGHLGGVIAANEMLEAHMDETVFDIDSTMLAEASRRFPAARLAPVAPHPRHDLSYLAAPAAEFCRHAWDEGGH